MLAKNIRNIVFLSVQGVEDQKNIPHYKLEKLILNKGMDYVFLRPSYFMQNLTTTLIQEIQNEGKITTSVKDITGKEPGTLEEFIEREKPSFQ